MTIISQILKRAEFEKEPPVLLDIGASGTLHEKWKDIARFSICIAFDADDRDISFAEEETKNYKKLYILNRIVTEHDVEDLEFYLTKSPYCSSTLQPDLDKIWNWEIADLFTVEKIVRLKAVTLNKVLSELRIKKIDWFKTDSQGTDLRLFKSLGKDIINTILAAEFEPGIIDVYKGEDKLHNLMAFMDEMPFWMSDITILGFRRANKKLLAEVGNVDNELLQSIRTSPNWAEVTYLNSFTKGNFSKRDYLLGCIFAIIEKQFGVALELSAEGNAKFPDSDFREIEHFVVAQLSSYCEKRIVSKAESVSLIKNKLRQYLPNFLFRRLKQLGKLKGILSKHLTLRLVCDAETDSQLLLEANCRWYARPQFRFWARKSNAGDFIMLADWSPDNVCIIPKQHENCFDYGVHVRSGAHGDWQNQAWIANSKEKS